MSLRAASRLTKTNSVWVWFAVLVVFNVVDIVCTNWEVSTWGLESEANPVMASAMSAHGIGALVLIKFLSLGSLAWLLAIVGQRLLRGVAFLAVVFGVLGAYHLAILYSTHLVS